MNAIKISESKNEIPDTPEARLKELNELSLKQKENFLPPVGSFFTFGPFKYRVTFINAGQLRFTASLADVIIKGINDGSEKVSLIVDPNTGKGVVK